MFEQETKQLMNLDCIENVEPINDSSAESVNGGLDLNYVRNGRENRFESGFDTAYLNLGKYNAGDTHAVQVFNTSDSYAEYDVALYNADSGNFLEWTHQGRLTANSDQWTRFTVAHDEMKGWGDRNFRLRIRKVV